MPTDFADCSQAEVLTYSFLFSGIIFRTTVEFLLVMMNMAS